MRAYAATPPSPFQCWLHMSYMHASILPSQLVLILNIARASYSSLLSKEKKEKKILLKKKKTILAIFYFKEIEKEMHLRGILGLLLDSKGCCPVLV